VPRLRASPAHPIEDAEWLWLLWPAAERHTYKAGDGRGGHTELHQGPEAVVRGERADAFEGCACAVESPPRRDAGVYVDVASGSGWSISCSVGGVGALCGVHRRLHCLGRGILDGHCRASLRRQSAVQRSPPPRPLPMPRESFRYCWSGHDAHLRVVESVDGEHRQLAVTARAGGWGVELALQTLHYQYVIQHLRGIGDPETEPFRQNRRRHGLGTMVVNTAIAYLQHHDTGIDNLFGHLSSMHDHLFGENPAQVAADREAFAARFGVVVKTGEWFTVPIASLRPVPQFTLMGRPMMFVPFNAFVVCTHDHR
jgi:hypothetical protein